MSLSARIGRICLAAALLWLVWGAWKPAAPRLPGDVAVLGSRAALERLAPGREFVVEGVLLPAGTAARETWRGRFVFREAARVKDDMGMRHLRVARDGRPPVRLRVPWGEWTVPAGSYSLEHAPEIPPRPWHARNQENRGFRAGDPAVARGVVRAPGVAEVRELGEGPLERYRRRASTADAWRGLLHNGFRIVLSLFVLAFAASAVFPPRRPAG